jgi:hypothetical protein
LTTLLAIACLPRTKPATLGLKGGAASSRLSRPPSLISRNCAVTILSKIFFLFLFNRARRTQGQHTQHFIYLSLAIKPYKLESVCLASISKSNVCGQDRELTLVWGKSFNLKFFLSCGQLNHLTSIILVFPDSVSSMLFQKNRKACELTIFELNQCCNYK